MYSFYLRNDKLIMILPSAFKEKVFWGEEDSWLGRRISSSQCSDIVWSALSGCQATVPKSLGFKCLSRFKSSSLQSLFSIPKSGYSCFFKTFMSAATPTTLVFPRQSTARAQKSHCTVSNSSRVRGRQKLVMKLSYVLASRKGPHSIPGSFWRWFFFSHLFHSFLMHNFKHLQSRGFTVIVFAKKTLSMLQIFLASFGSEKASTCCSMFLIVLIF